MNRAETLRFIQEAYGWDISFPAVPNIIEDAERQEQLRADTWDELVNELSKGNLAALKVRQADLEESLEQNKEAARAYGKRSEKIQQHLKELRDIQSTHGPKQRVQRAPYTGDVEWVIAKLEEEYEQRSKLLERHYENYLLEQFQLKTLNICLTIYRRIGLPPRWPELHPALDKLTKSTEQDEVAESDRKRRFPYGRRNPGGDYMRAVLKLKGRSWYQKFDLSKVTPYCQAIVRHLPQPRKHTAFFDWIKRHPRERPFYSNVDQTPFSKVRKHLESEAERLEQLGLLDVEE